MLTFEQIVTGVQLIAKGYQVDKIQESLNSAQVQYASDFHFKFLKRIGYLKDNGDETYSIYEDTAFATLARILKIFDPGVVNSNGRPLDHRLEGQKVILLENNGGASVAGYQVHYIKLPVFLDSINVAGSNYSEESDWNVADKNAIVALTASYLFDRKQDKENAKYHLDKYRLLYGPTAKHVSASSKGMSTLPGAKTSLSGKKQSWI